MSSQGVETVKLGNCILGTVKWNAEERLATFTPHLPELSPLKRRLWGCPVQARIEVQRYAREVGVA